MRNVRFRAVQRGRQHIMVALPQIEACITTRPASTAASSEPGSEISSLMESEGFSENNLSVSTTGSIVGDFEVHESIGVTSNMAGVTLPYATSSMPLTGMAMPPTPGTIQTSDVPLIDLPQTTEGLVVSPLSTSVTRHLWLCHFEHRPLCDPWLCRWGHRPPCDPWQFSLLPCNLPCHLLL